MRIVWAEEARPAPRAYFSIVEVQDEAADALIDRLADGALVSGNVLYADRIGDKRYAINWRQQVAFTKSGVAQVSAIPESRYVEAGEVA